MDSTGSQRKYAIAIKEVIRRFNLTKAEIYQLVEFNDDSSQPTKNGQLDDVYTNQLVGFKDAAIKNGQLDDDWTKTYDSTTDYNEFIRQVEGLTFSGGGDDPEQMFQGLLNACEVSKDKAIITVTLDSGTHKKELEDQIADCLKKKNATLIIAFNPLFKYKHLNLPDDVDSLERYERLALATGGKVLNAENLDETVEATIQALEKEYIDVIWDLCNCKKKFTEDRVPLYRYWGNNDHLYTTNSDEIGTTTYGEIGHYNYKSEGVACMVLARGNAKGSVPLYRYWKEHGSDHFYTTNANEIGTTTPGKIGNDGYKFEGIAGYCFSTRVAGTVPFYRYWKSSITDHFYTTNWAELGKGKDGWEFQGVQCYVFARTVSG